MPDTWYLLNGKSVQVAMPNLYGILATVGAVPSQQMIEVLNLLDQDGVRLPSADPGLKFLHIRNRIRGMYALCSLMLVSPRLNLDGTPGEGEIAPADLAYADVEALYSGYFRGGYRYPVLDAPATAEPDRAAEPAPDGRDLRQETE